MMSILRWAFGWVWRPLDRLENAVNELAGIAALIARTSDRLVVELREQQEMANAGLIAALRERFLEQDAEHRRWAEHALARAIDAARPRARLLLAAPRPAAKVAAVKKKRPAAKRKAVRR
jgi:hypothetical protein